MIVSRLPHTLAALSLIGLLSVGAPAAHADTPAQVVVGGTLIHVIRTSWGGHSPEQRADQVQQRLIPALAQGPVSAKDITVGMMQDDWCVLLRGKRFLTADPAAAQQQHSSPQSLAEHWATHLREVLPGLMQTKGK